ncbi:orange carotenoid protein N-terminal domain-containing protein [Iningainema tapete]|uniref:Orange carotenoid-binding protein n=1 Tax=Iningainema tapete BLCC-T55 TaxID=2748662 RepID=A0A8J6XJI4_9CYAN|nr:Orange carotenoid-binding protein [Iningainema tapete BLCC-T55]
MTSTNVNRIEEAVSAFQSLDIDDRLAVLASLYTKISSAIPANAKDALPTQDAQSLVTQVEKLSQEEQVSALRDLLPAEKTDQDATMLDPNPSKALGELVTGGGTKLPTHKYGSMNSEGKLAFWYLVAQKLGSGFVGIPSDFQLTQPATQVLNLLESLNTEDLVSFLKVVL